MSKYYKNETPTPTCHYYGDHPCERPRECPVHGPPLERPRKKLHFLRKGLFAFTWRLDEPIWHKTFCGIFLHRRLGKPGECKHIENYFERRMQLELEGWTMKWIPSDDPSYEVFQQVGRGTDSEILVATDEPPIENNICSKCLRLDFDRKIPNKGFDLDD
jgi:hypothetical protein